MNLPKDLRSWEQAVTWLREQPECQELVFAAYFDDPLIVAANRYWQSTEWQAIKSFLPQKRGRVLDVGAGRGIGSYALAKEGFTVTALEPDASALVGAQAIRDLASDSNLPIEVAQEFSEKLPFEDAHFDVVFARAVLHHTDDLNAACKEFFRVLKPGGLLIAIREHVISKPKDLAAFLDLHPLHKYYGGENAFLLAQYESAIRSAGFNLETVLAPFESAINYSPNTEIGIQVELAKRLSLGHPKIQEIIISLLKMPVLWTITRFLLEHLDHRPGRHYSFVARRN